MCQVMHSHFLRNSSSGVYGELAPGKLEVLSHLDSFDLVTTLTDQQREDMELTQLATSKLHTVSNFTHELPGTADVQRDSKQGAMIARLARQKRVTDAVSAVHEVSGEIPGITLDVFGDGDSRGDLDVVGHDVVVTERG